MRRAAPASEAPDPRAKPTGFALFLVLMAVLLLVAAGALMALHIQHRLGEVLDLERNLHLQALIDSGYAFAAAQVARDYGYSAVVDLELDGGVVEVDVVHAVTFGQPQGLRRVELRASYRGKVRRARGLLFVERPGERPQLYGLESVPLEPGDRIGFE
ncbi:MAG: hypothetical protein AAGF23_16430 [Acidobacteriota bacterium]